MIQEYPQVKVACEQLEVALELWFDRRCLFSVITLAGAAEEIFGKIVSERGGKHALDTLKEGVAALYQAEDLSWVPERANRARNSLKHKSQSGFARLDAEEEARDMLNRAIDNYWRLAENLTPAMRRFRDECHAA